MERIKIQKGIDRVTDEDVEQFLERKRATSNPLCLVNSNRGLYTWVSTHMFRVLTQVRGLRDYRVVHFLRIDCNDALRRTFLGHLQRRGRLKAEMENNPEMKRRNAQTCSFLKLLLNSAFGALSSLRMERMGLPVSFFLTFSFQAFSD